MDIPDNVLDLLSRGLKFVPKFTKINIFYLIYNFYISLNQLNNNCFFKKSSAINSNKESNSNMVNANKENNPNIINSNKNNNSNVIHTVFKYLNKEYPKPTSLRFSIDFLDSFRINYMKNILSQLKMSKDEFKINLNSIRKALLDIKKNNLIITTADKNIGITILTSNIYNQLCFQHLTDVKTYEKIDFNPQFKIFSDCSKELISLNNNNHISDKVFKCLYPKIHSKKLASFSIMPKLHKHEKFGIRPLINCSFTTLSVISKFIDFFLKPIVNKHFTYIKDSQNLIQLTEKTIIDKNTDIYSADFESLYTNIPIDKALEITIETISKYNYEEFDSFGFYSLLKLVLKNNYFYFKCNNKYYFYLQIFGLSMGSPCSPNVANIYLSYFELRYKHMLNVSLYYRFIDDVLYSDTNGELTRYFHIIYPDLKLNCIKGNSVIYLDTNISRNSNNTLNFDLYVKPTFTGSYLDVNSNHPPFIFRGIVISLVSRIRRICTDLNNYYYHCSKLFSYLILKGYKASLISNIIRNFSNVNRKSLIQYKEKNNIMIDSLFFITYFDNNVQNSSQYIQQIWNQSLPEDSFMKKFLLKAVYKNSPNLRSYFISKFKLPFSNFSYYKCDSFNCKICKYAITDNFLLNNNDIPIAIPTLNYCKSKQIIYFIHCVKCKKFYIGETGRTTHDRIKEHIYNINFIINNKNNRTKLDKRINNSGEQQHLYEHFKEDHTLEDFRFQVFICNINSYRLRLETDLIYIFNTIFPMGLNSKTLLYNTNFESYISLC